MLTALTVAAVVCIASSNGGTTSQDLKTGYLVGATPRKQQLAIVMGTVTLAMVIGLTMLCLNQAGIHYTNKGLPLCKLAIPPDSPRQHVGQPYDEIGSKSRDSELATMWYTSTRINIRMSSRAATSSITSGKSSTRPTSPSPGFLGSWTTAARRRPVSPRPTATIRFDHRGRAGSQAGVGPGDHRSAHRPGGGVGRHFRAAVRRGDVSALELPQRRSSSAA